MVGGFQLIGIDFQDFSKLSARLLEITLHFISQSQQEVAVWRAGITLDQLFESLYGTSVFAR